MPKIAGSLLFALLLALPLFAAGPALTDYDVVLIPVFFFGDGANGSQWETEVTMASVDPNSASMPVPLFEEPFAGECGTPDGLIEEDFARSICKGFASPSGLLLYIPKSLELSDVQFNARIRDLSRQATSAGTEIPVVQESEFRSTPFSLLNIPSDERFRANLRVYATTETYSAEYRFIHAGGPIGMKIYDSRDLSSALVNTTIELSAPEAIDGSGYLTRPGFASIGNLVATYPQLANVPSYTIRLQPYQSLADPPHQSAVWAFVTITNNETQHVTTISP